MNRRSVVVVDDLAELRQILRLILEHGGPFRVVGEGRDAEEAVALAAEHHPDLLLMDVEMPGGSGWDVLPRVREVAPETLVVILSGSRVDHHPAGTTSIAAAVLEKGLPPKELNAALIEVLGADSPPFAPGSGELATADDALVSAATRIERQQRDLTRTSAELDAFASVAGHDLAQPLQVAYGYLEMLRADYADRLDPTAASWLDAAVGSLDRMRVLVQAMLSFSRWGARPLRRSDVDLGEVLDDAVAQVPEELTSRPWELRRGQLPSVRADREQLATILQELLANALRFSALDAGAVISVAGEETDEGWVVTVSDRGPGVPPALADRAFDAFQRGSSPSGRGPGLGLAVCRKLVEGHGGRIWLDAAADGGAVFRFSLPRL